MNKSLTTFDTQINDYLLTASGHLKASKGSVDGRKLAAYSAAASSALVMMSQAEAAIVFNGGDAPPISVVNGAGTGTIGPGAGYRLFDMDGDNNNDFAIWSYGSNLYPGNNGIAPATSGNAIVGGYSGSNDVRKLSAGWSISASRSWTGSNSAMTTSQDIAYGPGSGASNWSGGTPEFGFVGVRFSNQAGLHYGWICMKSSPSTHAISVQSYAYQSSVDTPIKAGDTGNGIHACAAPVPTPVPVIGPIAYGLEALALGGLGLSGLRRRRGKQDRTTTRQ